MANDLREAKIRSGILKKREADYVLEEQVGFILRQAAQRHVVIFSAMIPAGLTPTQFSVINMLDRLERCSQNQLGRLVAMDAATVKGVIDRLGAKGLTKTALDPADARQVLVSLTTKGRVLAKDSIAAAQQISEKTLEPLTATERNRLLALLKKIA